MAKKAKSKKSSAKKIAGKSLSALVAARQKITKKKK
jgi:hypothetical protein